MDIKIFHWGAKYLNLYPLNKPLSSMQAQHRKGLKTRQIRSPEPGTILMTPFGNPAFTVNSADFKAAIDVTWKYISHLRASYHHLEIHKGLKCSKWQSVYFSYLLPFPSRHLLVQSQQCKQKNNVWNLFKVSNKDTRWTDFTLCSGVPIVGYEQVNVDWVPKINIHNLISR